MSLYISLLPIALTVSVILSLNNSKNFQMATVDKPKRLLQIPVVYARGDYFTIGFIMGRQVRSLIEDHLERSEYFQNTLLPAYETPEGKELYEKNLELCISRFPNYVIELEGMASGAQIPFYKLLLLNLEVFTTSFAAFMQKKYQNENTDTVTGCTSILSHGEQLLLGHTEDTQMSLLNNVFILSAEIVDEGGVILEKFSTLTYAGCLPGYTMGFNEHFVHSVNTLYPVGTSNQKSPRAFVARSLLRAKSLDDVVEILKDSGKGIADGFSLNAIFPNTTTGVKAYNIEITPNSNGNESILNVLEVMEDETYAHCNKFLRIQDAESARATISSTRRHAAVNRHPKPERIEVVNGILSDRSDLEYSIFRRGDGPTDSVVTVAVGIFDLGNRKWQIYAEAPNSSEPIVELPLPY